MTPSSNNEYIFLPWNLMHESYVGLKSANFCLKMPLLFVHLFFMQNTLTVYSVVGTTCTIDQEKKITVSILLQYTLLVTYCLLGLIWNLGVWKNSTHLAFLSKRFISHMLAEALTHDIIGHFTLFGNNLVSINLVNKATSIRTDFIKKAVDECPAFIIPPSDTVHLIQAHPELGINMPTIIYDVYWVKWYY